MKYCYNHTEFKLLPNLSKLQRNTNSKYQVSPTTLKSQSRQNEYKIEINVFSFYLPHFLSPVHSLPLLLSTPYCLCTLRFYSSKTAWSIKTKRKSSFSFDGFVQASFSFLAFFVDLSLNCWLSTTSTINTYIFSFVLLAYRKFVKGGCNWTLNNSWTSRECRKIRLDLK